MSTRASKPTVRTPKHSQKHTTKHLKRPMHLRDEAERALASRGIRPWHVAMSVVITASLVVAGLHTDAIADVLGLSATSEPVQVSEAEQPAATDAAAADATGAAAPDELASAERETEETGRAAAEEAAREADEAAARAAEEERASGAENGSGGGASQDDIADSADASQDAEAKAAADAKAKEEAEAKARADAEAKAKEEADAKAKAEEQARRDSFELAPEGVDEGLASGKDFSSQRLLIAGVSREQLTPATRVLSEHAGMFLTQFDTAEKARNAYLFYKGKVGAALVEPDTTISAADGAGSGDAVAPGQMSETDNPLAKLNSSAPGGAGGYTIALVDTGYTGAGVVDSASMLGGSAADDNGHGTAMAERILEAHPGARIVSVKALGADGRGTVSSVYAAIEYARESGANVINLSLSAWRRADNEVVADAIAAAAGSGQIVVGAAGNSGTDASYTIPGGVGAALVMGACDDSGARIASSNYGATVDAYATAGSTSEATAAMSGWLSVNGVGSDWQSRVAEAIADGTFSDGGAFAVRDEPRTEDAGPTDVSDEAEGFVAASTRYFSDLSTGNTLNKGDSIYFDKEVEFTYQAGNLAYEIMQSGRTYTLPRAAKVVSIQKRSYCTLEIRSKAEVNFNFPERHGSGTARTAVNYESRLTISSYTASMFNFDPGYTFSGVYKESTFNNKLTSDSVLAGMVVTRYVKTKGKTIAVSRVNAGANIGTQNSTFGDEFTVDNPTAYGYAFDGWTISDMSTDVEHYVDGASIGKVASYDTKTKATKFKNLKSEGTVKLNGNWTPKDVTVTLSSADDDVYDQGTQAYSFAFGSGQIYADSEKTQEISANAITVPKRTNYTFDGYYSGPDGTGSKYFDASGNYVYTSSHNKPSSSSSTTYSGITDTIESDVTLYAKWAPKVFSVNMDNAYATTPGSPETLYQTYGTRWSAEPTGLTEFVDAITQPERVHTLRFVGNIDGAGNVPADLVGNNLGGSYWFTGYYKDLDDSVRWDEATRTTVFDLSGKTQIINALGRVSSGVAGTNATVFSDENAPDGTATINAAWDRATAMTLPEGPTLAGYDFDGWYTTPGEGEGATAPTYKKLLSAREQSQLGETPDSPKARYVRTSDGGTFAGMAGDLYAPPDNAAKARAGKLDVDGQPAEASATRLYARYVERVPVDYFSGTATDPAGATHKVGDVSDELVVTKGSMVKKGSIFNILNLPGEWSIAGFHFDGWVDDSASANKYDNALGANAQGTDKPWAIGTDESPYWNALNDAGQEAHFKLTATWAANELDHVELVDGSYDWTYTGEAQHPAVKVYRKARPGETGPVLVATTTGTAPTETVDAAADPAAASGSTSGAITVTWTDSSLTRDAAEAGSAVVTVSGVAGRDFQYSSPVTATYDIVKRDGYQVQASDVTLTYDAADHGGADGPVRVIPADTVAAEPYAITYTYTPSDGRDAVTWTEAHGKRRDGSDAAAVVGSRPTICNVADSGIVEYTVSPVNYNSVTGQFRVDVLKRDVGVQGSSAQDRQYDGTTTVRVLGGSLTTDAGAGTGLMAADANRVSLVQDHEASGSDAAWATGTISGKDASASAYDVTVSGFSLEGTALGGAYAAATTYADNYNLLQPTGLTVAISKRNVTYAWPAQATFDYDDTEKAYRVESVSTGVAGESLSVASYTQDLDADTPKTDHATMSGRYLSEVAALTPGPGTLLDNYNWNGEGIDFSHKWTLGQLERAPEMSETSYAGTYDGEGHVVSVAPAPEYVGGPYTVTYTYEGQTQVVKYKNATTLASDNTGQPFSFRNVKTDGDGTYRVSYTVSADNYKQPTSGTLTAKVDPRPVTVQGAAATDRDYDGTTAVQVTGGAIAYGEGGVPDASRAGVVGGDTLTLSAATGVVQDKNASADAKAVAFEGDGAVPFALQGDATTVANYALTQPAYVTATISKAPVTIQWPANATYNYANTLYEYVKDGREEVVGVNGEKLKVKTYRNDPDNKVVPSATNVDNYVAEAVELEGVGGSNPANYDLDHASSNKSHAWVVDKAKLYVRANDKTISYGDAAANAGVQYKWFESAGGGTQYQDGAPTDAQMTGSLAYAYVLSGTTTPYATTTDAGTAVSIVPSGIDSANYIVEFEPGVLTVDPREVTISWNEGENLDTFVYDGTEKTYHGALSLGNLANGERLAPGEQSGLTGTAKGDYTATLLSIAPEAGQGEGTKASNYRLPADVTHAWHITQAVNTIGSVSIADWTYGKTPAAPTIAASTDATKPMFGASTVRYAYKQRGAADGTYTSDVPTNAGDYTVRATIPATSDYGEATATADFTIKKANITVRANDAQTTRGEDILSGTQIGWTITGDLVQADKGAIDALVTVTTDADKTTAHRYTTTATVAAATSLPATNYNIATQAGTYTVTRNDIKVNATDYSDIYDGQRHGIAMGFTDRNGTSINDDKAPTVYYVSQDFSEAIKNRVNEIQGIANETEYANAVADLKDNPLYLKSVNTNIADPSVMWTDVRNDGEGASYPVYYLVVSADSTPDVIFGQASVTIQARPITVAANPGQITYGDATSATGYAAGTPATPATAPGGVTYKAGIDAAKSGFAPGEDASRFDTTGLAFTYDYAQGGNVGDYNITPSGITQADKKANYAVSYERAKLSVLQREVQLAWDPATLTYVYDASDHVPTASITNRYGADSENGEDAVGVAYTPGTVAQRNVGTGYVAAVASLTGAKATNYSLSDDNAGKAKTFSITEAPNAATVDITGWTYGETPNAPTVRADFSEGTVTYEYFQAGAATDAGPVATEPVGIGAKVAEGMSTATPAGDYYVKATVAPDGHGNHATATSWKRFTIAKRAITVSADSKSAPYTMAIAQGDLTWTLSAGSLANHEELQVTPTYATQTSDATPVAFDAATSPVKRAGEGVGSEVVPYNGVIVILADNAKVVGGGSDLTANYDVTLVSGSYTVTPAPLTVVVSPYVGTYDAQGHDAYSVTQSVAGNPATVFWKGTETSDADFVIQIEGADKPDAVAPTVRDVRDTQGDGNPRGRIWWYAYSRNYDVRVKSGTVEPRVNQRQLTVTPAGATITYGDDPAPALLAQQGAAQLGLAWDGFAQGEGTQAGPADGVLNVSGLAFETAWDGAGKPYERYGDVGTYEFRAKGITQASDPNGNYAISYPASALRVVPLTATFAWDPAADEADQPLAPGQKATFVYSETNAAPDDKTVTPSITNIQNGDAIAVDSVTDATKNQVGGYTAKVASLKNTGAADKAKNYKVSATEATGTRTWSIAKDANVWTSKPAVDGWEYAGSDVAARHRPTSTAKYAKAGVEAVYEWQRVADGSGNAVSEAWVAWGDGPSQAGTYKMRATLADTENWGPIATTEMDGEFKIKRKPLSVEGRRDMESGYLENLVPLRSDVEGLAAGDTYLALALAYTGYEDEACGTVHLDGTIRPTWDRGTYHLMPRVTDATALNNYDISYAAGTYTITPPTATVSVTGPAAKRYDGTPSRIKSVEFSRDGRGYTAAELGITMYYSDSPIDSGRMADYKALASDAERAAFGIVTSIDDPRVTQTDAGTKVVYYFADCKNYLPKPQFGSVNLTVEKLRMTVTAQPATITYGQAASDAKVDVSYSGLLAGETAEGLRQAGKLRGDVSFDSNYRRFDDVPAAGSQGGLTLTPKGLVADNYDIDYVGAPLTVLPLPVQVAWSGDSFVFDGTEHEVSARVLNAQNGDDITLGGYKNSRATAAGAYRASAETLSGDKAGNYTIDPSSGATHDWTIGASQNEIVGISAAGWTYDGKTCDGSAGGHPKPTATATFGQESMRFEYSLRADFSQGTDTLLSEPPTDAGTYYVRAVVDGTADYAAAVSAPTSFTIAPAKVGVAAKDVSVPYEDGLTRARLTEEHLTAGKGAYSVDGQIAEGDDLGIELSLEEAPLDVYQVGSYKIDLAWSENPNYEVTLSGATLRVVPDGALAPVAQGFAGTYDGAAHAASVTVPGAATGTYEVRYSTEHELTADNYETGTKVAPTATNVSDSCDVHYYVRDITGNHGDASGTTQLTIARRALTLTPADKTITYGEAADLQAGQGTYSGLVGDDLAEGSAARQAMGALALETPYGVGDDAGSYAINVDLDGVAKDDRLANYDVRFVPGTLTVRKATATFDWDYTKPFSFDNVEHVVSATVNTPVEHDDVYPGGYEDNAKTRAGSYTARVTGLSGTKAKNYEIDEATRTRAWVIGKSANAVSSVRSTGWTYGAYDETSDAPTCEATWGADTATYEWSRSATPFVKLPDADLDSHGVPRHAGSYYVKATVPATDDYEGASAVSTSPVRVSPAPLTITALDQSIERTATGTGDAMREAVKVPAAPTVQPTGPSGIAEWSAWYEKVSKLFSVAGADEADENDLYSHVKLALESHGTYPVGDYAITPSFTAAAGSTLAGDYDVTCVAGEFHVTKGDAVVSAAGWSGTYDGQPHGISLETTDRHGTALDSTKFLTTTPIQIVEGSTDDLSGPVIKISRATMDAINGDDAAAAASAAGTLSTRLNQRQDVATVVTDQSVAPTNAGTTTVHYVVLTNPEDPAITVGSRDVTIAKRDLVVTARDQRITYGDEPSASAVAGREGVSYATPAGMADDLRFATSATDAFAYGYAEGQDVGGGSFEVWPQGVTSGNYNIKPAAGTLTVDRREATLDWAPASGSFAASPENSLAYNGAEQSVVATVSNAGSDDVSVSSYLGNAQTSVGSYQARAVQLSGAKAANYALGGGVGAATLDWQITKATNDWVDKVSIDGWTYGDIAKAPAARARLDADRVVFEYAAVAGDAFPAAVPDGLAWTRDVPSAAGLYYVRATVPDTADCAALETAPADYARLTVSSAQVTVKAEPKTSVYGEEPRELTYKAEGGPIPGDAALDVALSATTAATPDAPQVTSETAVGEYPINVALGQNSTNYQIQAQGSTYKILPAGLAVSAEGWESTYDTERHGVNVQTDVPLKEEDRTVYYSSVPLTADNIDLAIANGDAQQADPSTPWCTTNPLDERISRVEVGEQQVYYYVKSVNYVPVPLSGELTVKVDKALLTIKANDAQITFGDEATNAGVTYEGFVGTESEANLTGELAYDVAYERLGNVGEYAITPSGLTSDSYDIAFETGTLKVSPYTLTHDMLTLDPEDSEFDGKTHAPEAVLEIPAGAGHDAYRLTKGRDFTVSGDASSADFGTHTLKVEGTGNFTGELERSWRVTGEVEQIEKKNGVAVEVSVLADGTGVKVDGMDAQLALSLMTAEQRARVEAGEEAVLYLEIHQIDELPEEDRAATLAKLEELGARAGMYLDMRLWLQVGDDPAESISDLKGSELTITITAPDSLVNNDANVVRTMWGIRTHEGAADVVGGPVTEPTIAIKTGLFSSYTLAVRDDEVGGKGDGFEGDRLAPMAHVAPTGDPFAAAIPASAIIAGVAALFVLAGRMGVRRGRKKEL